MNELLDILNEIESLDFTSEEVELPGYKCKVEKDNGVTRISIEKECFDDSKIKAIVSAYKKAIQELDDDVFLQVAEDLSSKIDMPRFNELLEFESFNEEEASEVHNCINQSIELIADILQKKILSLVDSFTEFNLLG